MSERGSTWVLKFLAVFSAVALGAGYVWWKGSEAGSMNDEGAEGAEVAVPEVPEEPSDEKPVQLIIGSKSPGGDVIVLSEDMFATESADVQPPLMPGSKSVIIHPATTFPSNTPESPMEIDDGEIEVLPGSKSLAPIFRQQKAKEKKP